MQLIPLSTFFFLLSNYKQEGRVILGVHICPHAHHLVVVVQIRIRMMDRDSQELKK
jgi:hypothetical protein